MAVPLGLVWLPWGRGRSPGTRLAAVGVWPVPWAPSGALQVQWARLVAVWAWPVQSASYGRRGGVAGPMGPVWPPWGRGHSNGPRMAAVGA